MRVSILGAQRGAEIVRPILAVVPDGGGVDNQMSHTNKIYFTIYFTATTFRTILTKTIVLQ